MNLNLNLNRSYTAARSALPLLAFVGLLCATSLSSAAEALYAKKPSWAETMAASREALAGYKRDGGFETVATKIIRGGEEAEHITADIEGLKTLSLVATVGDDTYNFDQAVWGDPVVITKDGEKVSLSHLGPRIGKRGLG